MDKLIDYVKYTVALAIGLLVYLPANFLPTDSPIHHWIIGLTVAALGISALAGILMYTRATKILLDGDTSDGKGWLALWGNTHFIVLIICYCIGAYYFVSHKVIAPKSPVECVAELPQADGSNVSIRFACVGKVVTN